MTDRLSRRHLLRATAALGMAFACPLCRPAAADEWGYDGALGPDHWGTLSKAYQACSNGKLQTPIDLHGPVTGIANSVKRDYKAMPLKIINNGHTIQVNATPGSSATIDDERFELLQFHFHHPSEHLLLGEAKALEAHFVHRNAGGKLAVLGVFLAASNKALKALDPVWDALPSNAGPEYTVAGATVMPEGMFPSSQTHYRYDGSLTTPPCAEGVSWVVYAEPVDISTGQVSRFAKLFALNARPVQPLNDREMRMAY